MIKATIQKLFNLSPKAYIGLITLTSAIILLSALAFEHIGGLKPCFLCYRQRWAYYAALFLGPLGLYLIYLKKWPLARLAAFTLALAFIANMIFGSWHAGIEWGFWPGPETCSGVMDNSADGVSLLERLDKIKIVPCGVANWRMFGISFAGYNAIFSLGLAVIALFAYVKLPRKIQNS